MRAESLPSSGGSLRKRKNGKRNLKELQKPERPERDQEVFALLRALKGMSAAEISRESIRRGRYVSAATIANWRKSPSNGGTRYPQRFTMDAAARVVGLRFKLVGAD